MAEAPESRGRYARYVALHSIVVRVTHWFNAVAIFHHDRQRLADLQLRPAVRFPVPGLAEVGGWPEISQHRHNEQDLADALQLHLAAMWLRFVNLLVYLGYGLLSAHFRRALLPIWPPPIVRDLWAALKVNGCRANLATR